VSLPRLEQVFSQLHDALTDPVAVHRPQGEGFEDEHVERALQQVGLSLAAIVPS